MEFEKLLRMRQSTRKYQEKQIPQEHLEKIIDAANRRLKRRFSLLLETFTFPPLLSILDLILCIHMLIG